MTPDGSSEAMNNAYYSYCNGITVWHKVERKTELDLMKEKYASGDYILITPEYRTKEWIVVQNPEWDCDNYKIIHKKHKDVLDTYLADNSVDIEVCGTYYRAEYTDLFEIGESDFIDSYNENWEYRIKPKKKTISLAMFTCYRVCTDDWVMVNIDVDIEKFRNEYNEGFTNHHEIPNTRYEIEVYDK